jgi:diketogulonate reductase-like aldo/keto reductase
MQVEMHPMLPQTELLSYCKAKSIHLTAYTPLGKTKDIIMKHPAVTSVADRLHCTAAQVILSWAIIRGTSVVPKTANEQRLQENLVVGWLHTFIISTLIECMCRQLEVRRSIS